MKKDSLYSVNIFSRILLGLLAVFYVSIFTIEATHGHGNLIEASSSDGVKKILDTDDCKICAYFTHHETKEIAISTVPSLAPIVFQAVGLGTFEFTKNYQSDLQNFTNRGPPYLLI